MTLPPRSRRERAHDPRRGGSARRHPPSGGAVPGFRSSYRVTEGRATALIVCDDQAGIEAPKRAAAAWIAENLPDAGAAADSGDEVAIAF